MGDLSLDRTDATTPEDRALVQRGIDEGNAARHGDDVRELSIFLRDAGARIWAGLVGDTRWGWLHVSLLWVEEALQGQGWGSRLLAEAEREAVARGCRGVFLDTLSTQAPEFYRQRGYEVVGAVEGFPPGHRLIYLTKSLAPAPADGDTAA